MSLSHTRSGSSKTLDLLIKTYMNKYRIILIVLLLISTACRKSGTWIDDKQNWQRAFKTRKPEDVAVVHSQFWRSPHWTYEFEYYFQIKANKQLRDQLLGQNDLEQQHGSNAVLAIHDLPQTKPIWFLPKPVNNYDTWRYKNDPKGNFKIFIDKEYGDLFITDRQL